MHIELVFYTEVKPGLTDTLTSQTGFNFSTGLHLHLQKSDLRISDLTSRITPCSTSTRLSILWFSLLKLTKSASNLAILRLIFPIYLTLVVFISI
jgi:hypothetical protein